MKQNRIAYEKRMIEKMIRLYCRRKEGNRMLCADCRELLGYAFRRLDRCPFGEGKGPCKSCSVHCYRSDLRERMRIVMRFSGPRMLLFHPLDAIRHLLNI